MQPSTTRRRLLATTGLSFGLAGCTDLTDDSGSNGDGGDGATDDDNGTTDGDGGTTDGDDGTTDGGDDGPLSGLPDAVALEPVATGLEAPVGTALAPSDDLRYVVEQTGQIRAIGPDGVLEGPVLDLSDRITSGFEMGLLGLALHPDFASNRRAFVRYSSPPRTGTPEDYSHTFVLSEFEASDDGRSFDTDTERALLELPEPQGNHNAGDIVFGPEGLLYVPTGDGGEANDQGTGHVDDWYDAVEGGNGQDVTENLLGGILRIDVDGGSPDAPPARAGTDGDADRPYGIPEDNPLVGTDGLDEYYAWGLRNPWRLSFDDGDCYVADVGQDAYEEVNLLEPGTNYGWNVREGAHCFQAADCPTETPPDVRGGEPLVDPIIEYAQQGGEVSGISVIGGYVYRGDALPDLGGAYVFGDFQPAGRLFVSREPDDDGQWPIGSLEIADASVEVLYSFGRGQDGEVYALGEGSDAGTVWRLAPTE